MAAPFDASQSLFVQGFLAACGDLPSAELQRAASIAVDVHPAIASEFAKCGFVKQALGSGNGLQMPWMRPNTGLKAPTPGLPKPPTTPAAPPTMPPHPAPNAAIPPVKIMPEPKPHGAWQAATAPFRLATAPARAAGNALGDWEGSQQLFGFSKRNPAGDYVPTVTAASSAKPGPTPLQRVGSVARSLFGTVGQLGAIPADIARYVGGESDNFDYSKMMTRDMLSGINTNLGTNIGHEIEARPPGIDPRLYIGPDAGRQFFGDSIDQTTGMPVLSATNARAKHYGLTASLPDSQGGSALARAAGSAGQATLGQSENLAALSAMNIPKVSNPAASALLPAFVAGNSLMNDAMDSPEMSDFKHTQAHQGMLGNEQMLHEQMARQQALAMQKWKAKKTPIDGQAPQQPAQQAEQPQPPAAESVLTQAPQYQGIMEMIKSAPEQAKAMADGAIQQLHTAFSDPTSKQEVAAVSQTGGLTPDGQHRAMTALTAEGYNGEQAYGILSKMNGWEQLGLWGGLSVAGLGLLHAMSGGGGLASLLMTLLGVGAAGFTAGKAGLLDQGAQDLTTGLSDAVQGGPTPQVPDAIKRMFGSTFDQLPDGVLNAALGLVPNMSPELARKLDQAAGVGSWGNATMGFLGDVTGARNSQMQQMTGLNPQQQERLLQAWAAKRQ